MADKLFTTYWTELAAAALAHADAVGIEDTGGLYTATDVEAALAEVKTLADAAVTPAEAAAAYQPLAAVLTGTTASFTTADESKLDGITAGATDDTTVNNHIADTADAHDASAISVLDTGTLYTATDVEAALAEVKTIADAAVTPGEAAAAYQPLATVLTNTTASYTTAEASKLAGIEALADVTDTTNVTAAGALMDSEVDADIKTLALPASTTISAFGASLVDDADNTAARTTLGLGTMATATAADYLPLVAAGASVENIGAVEENVNTVASSGATETLDTSLFGVHDVTLSEACVFTFSNPAPSGKLSSFVLILRGAFTPTLPASVDWADAAAPTYTTPSVYTFTTVDGGTIWLGTQAGKAFG